MGTNGLKAAVQPNVPFLLLVRILWAMFIYKLETKLNQKLNLKLIELEIKGEVYNL